MEKCRKVGGGQNLDSVAWERRNLITQSEPLVFILIIILMVVEYHQGL